MPISSFTKSDLFERLVYAILCFAIIGAVGSVFTYLAIFAGLLEAADLLKIFSQNPQIFTWLFAYVPITSFGIIGAFYLFYLAYRFAKKEEAGGYIWALVIALIGAFVSTHLSSVALTVGNMADAKIVVMKDHATSCYLSSEDYELKGKKCDAYDLAGDDSYSALSNEEKLSAFKEMVLGEILRQEHYAHGGKLSGAKPEISSNMYMDDTQKYLVTFDSDLSFYVIAEALVKKKGSK